MPTVGKGFFPESYGATNRANDHLKLNRKSEANTYFIRALLLARKLGHRPIIVIPPVRSDYKKATGDDSKLLYKSLFEIIYDYHIEWNISLLNLYDSPLFLDEYFGDFDHLQPLGKGAQILSSMVFDATKANTQSNQSQAPKSNIKLPVFSVFNCQAQGSVVA